MVKQPQEKNFTIEDILGASMERKDALSLIRTDWNTHQTFLSFPKEEQERILSFIQGNRGLPILYDSFFKKIMDPILHPDRLEHFLSAILSQPIHIRAVLPREGTKLTDSSSLVIMDILVELSDGSIINIEMQKIGYAFPGARSSCYISDLIMRQYNRVKSQKKSRFSFRDLKPVYLIVLMENSSKEFKNVAPHYIHRECTLFDSGAHVHSLGNLIYISLDTFHSVVQNIDTELDAWLTFLSSDQPNDIIRLVNAYPEFHQCYQDIIEFRRNPKELIFMFSEALTIMDRNTVKYMCEEQQKEIASLTESLAERDSALAKKDSAIAEKDSTIVEKDSVIAALQAELEELKKG